MDSYLITLSSDDPDSQAQHNSTDEDPTTLDQASDVAQGVTDYRSSYPPAGLRRSRGSTKGAQDDDAVAGPRSPTSFLTEPLEMLRSRASLRGQSQPPASPHFNSTLETSFDRTGNLTPWHWRERRGTSTTQHIAQPVQLHTRPVHCMSCSSQPKESHSNQPVSLGMAHLLCWDIRQVMQLHHTHKERYCVIIAATARDQLAQCG